MQTPMEDVREWLEKWECAAKTPQAIVMRCKIILSYLKRRHTKLVADELGCHWNTANTWIQRRKGALPSILKHWTQKGFDRKQAVLALVQDQFRSGRNPTYSQEQVTRVVSLACEEPEKYERPLRIGRACSDSRSLVMLRPIKRCQSTLLGPLVQTFDQLSEQARIGLLVRELTEEVVMQGIAKSMSPASAWRFLNRIDHKPHKSQYWLNPKIEDRAEFEKDVNELCSQYQEAQELAKRGVRVVSTDEKTGIQALERCAPTKPTRPGLIERREFEYSRHGTLCLIPSFDVATGKIITVTIGPTRTEEDFLAHLKKTVATDPKKEWVFVCDQLNTHLSESLVRWVIDECNLAVTEEELGKKGKCGVLRRVQTRKQFLENTSHRIRFAYTPKHCSWMNQVEIWFGVVQAKAIRRGNFSSIEELKSKLLAFIEYYGDTMAKPFRWTYKGFP